uniref:Uncharacterized protein n=1 Tax=Escherichia coli TaxID=562 RepID=E9LLT0_ECOLX|nr:hypothetical protein ND11IncI1_111 [Escherichia coli]
MTSLKTSIKTITYLSDIGCLEIQGASLLRQKKRIYMKSHLLTEARTQKLICSLRRKGLDVTAERRESAMNSVMFRILIVSRILSQWKVPHINPRCGIVILTLKNDSGNRE